MRTLNDYFIHFHIENIGGSAQQHYAVAPDRGKIVAMFTCLEGTIATGDEDVTVKINGTACTGGVATITASGSAAWDQDAAYPTALNNVEAGDMIEVENDSACTNDIDLAVVIVVRR